MKQNKSKEKSLPRIEETRGQQRHSGNSSRSQGEGGENDETKVCRSTLISLPFEERKERGNSLGLPRERKEKKAKHQKSCNR